MRITESTQPTISEANDELVCATADAQADSLIDNDAEIESIDDSQQVVILKQTGIAILDSLVESMVGTHFERRLGKKPTQKDYYILCIDILLETARQCGLDFSMKNKNPYCFNGRYWQRIPQDSFESFLQSVGTKLGIPYGIIRDHVFAEKLMKQYVSVAHFPIVSSHKTPKINLRNGTLYFMSSGVELKPHNKEDGLCYQLDYDYDLSAEAPLFKKFMMRVQPDKAVRKLLFQYVAYVAYPYLNYEKILFLYGSGNNGKSVFLNVIRALFGEEQCCAFSLEGLTGKGAAEYQRAELGNYLLNVCSEISSRMGGIDIFKKLASREDLQGRSPCGKPFNVKDYATSIFSMNNLPTDVEQTEAFFRRFLIVKFAVCISDEEKDTDLAKKIIADEMSGVLNYVVRGMKTLLASGGFDIPPEVQNAVADFRKESDSVLMFIEEYNYRPNSKHYKSLADMYESYKQQCKDDGSRPLPKRTFTKRLRALGYEIVPKGHSKTIVVYVESADDAE